ncbi:MAG: hypothetical protein IKO94_10975, partial [Selenomonadaceae bacterium]|nr:hypothetical protein [Selenomonadaceae bacterium]
CLLGVYLDGKNSQIIKPPTCQLETSIVFCEDYRTEFNLFDFDKVQRYIRLSEMLRFKDENEFDDAMRIMSWCDEVFILIDIYPQASSKIVMDFFIKRLIQVYLMVKKSNVQSNVSLLVQDCLYEKLRELLEYYVDNCLSECKETLNK